jgi:hypothetical protein
VFLEKPKRFFAAFCEQEGVGFVGKRMLEDFSGDGRIVYHQNLNTVSRLVHALLGVAARKS